MVPMLARMDRLARLLLTILATLGLALLLPAQVVGAQDCSLTASPKSGVPGTEFVFKGQGFPPSTITLTRDGEAPVTVDVSDTSADSFRFSLVAEDSDVGKWHAVAEGCDASVSIRVTLPPTATAPTPPPADQGDTMQLAGLILLGVLFLSATALLLPRLTRATRGR